MKKYPVLLIVGSLFALASHAGPTSIASDGKNNANRKVASKGMVRCVVSKNIHELKKMKRVADCNLLLDEVLLKSREKEGAYVVKLDKCRLYDKEISKDFPVIFLDAVGTDIKIEKIIVTADGKPQGEINRGSDGRFAQLSSTAFFTINQTDYSVGCGDAWVTDVVKEKYNLFLTPSFF